MSNFPSELDTDAELPRVTNNVTEIGAEAINAIREAVFAIEHTLGANVDGSAASLKDRLDTVLNPDGTFKSAALVAAGLIALPITNAMVGTSAAIEESKLDLDHATQALYNAIISNDVDILVLQNNITSILANFLSHVSGTAFKHDGYQILLESAYPNTSPPNISPLTSVSIGEAIYALKNSHFDHISASKVGAHSAVNIDVDLSNLTVLTATNVQDALSELEVLGNTLFIDHRDDLHASGFSNFANSRDGYGLNRQFLPAQHGTVMTAVVSADGYTVEFDGYALIPLGVKPGDVVWISAPSAAVGAYTIESIGPRVALGMRPALDSDQVVIAGNIAYAGSVSAAIFTPSSTSTFKGSMAPTIRQSDQSADSIQVSRPNAARVLSLGINPRFINASHALGIEVGVGSGLTRSISVDNLHYDRLAAPATNITIDTIVERINHVLQNRYDGYAFPAAAYRVGDEMLLSHNWYGSDDFYISVTSSGSTAQSLYLLGFDGYGAAVTDIEIHPTHTAKYYVNGIALSDVAPILSATANVLNDTFAFPNGENPLALGVKTGHLLHLKSYSDTSKMGTYFISGVDASSVRIYSNAPIALENGVAIEILHDAIPLNELNATIKNALIETFYDYTGRGGYRIRSENDNFTNISVVDVSDNFVAGASDINIAATGAGGHRLEFSSGVAKEIPSDFNGRAVLRNSSNESSVTLDITSPIGTGTIGLTVHEHVLEEEVLELCSVWFDGSITLNHITDKRLFGSTGLDEIREDVVQAYAETPLRELRADGIVTGLDVITINYTDAESLSALGSNIYGALVRGGVAYADGVRVEVPTRPVFFSYTAASYVIYINHLGTIDYLNSSTDFSLTEVLDGYAGRITPLAYVTHSGSGTTPLSFTDIRYFINELDYKVDLVLDTTNRRIGNFATYGAAELYMQNMPFDSNLKLKVVSNNTQYAITTTTGTKHFNLDLAGSIGHLTLNSGIRLTSQSTQNVNQAHIAQLTINTTCDTAIINDLRIAGTVAIAGTLTGSSILFKNCRFDGAVSVDGSGSVVFDDCTFGSASTLSLDIQSLALTGCSILSSSTSIIARNLGVLSGNTFRPTGQFGTLRANITSTSAGLMLSGCVFDGSGTSKSLTLIGAVAVSECAFKDITASSSDIITIGSGSTPATTASITNSKFSGIAISGTARLSNIVHASHSLSIEDSVIENTCAFTNTTTQNLVCTKFMRNRNVASTSVNLDMAGSHSGEVSGNAGLTSVRVQSEIRAIENNIFMAAAIGYNVYLNNSAIYEISTVLVCGNYMQSGVRIGATAGRITISSNAFSGTLGIDFLASSLATEPVEIDGNIFDSLTALAFASAKTPLRITSNTFLTSISGDTTIRPGNRSIISGNIYLDTGNVIILVTTSTSDVSIRDNIFAGGLYFQGQFTSSRISGNRIDGALQFATSTTLTGSTISENIIDNMQFVSSNVFAIVGFTSNHVVQTTGSSNCTWDRSRITNSYLIGDSGSTLYIRTATDAYLEISCNTFGSDIELDSSVTVKSVNISGNNFLGNMLQITPVAEQCIISNNSAVRINLDAGADATVISNNDTIYPAATSADYTIQVTGTISNLSVHGNSVMGLWVTNGQNISIASNMIQGNLDLGASYAGALTISNLLVADNIVNQDIRILNHATSTRDLSDVLVNGNSCQNILIFTTDSSVEHTLTNTSICNNIVGSTMQLLSRGGSFNNSTLTALKVVSNNCGGDLVIDLGNGSGGSPPELSNIQITGNNSVILSIGATSSNCILQIGSIADNTAGDFSIGAATVDIAISHNRLNYVDLTGSLNNCILQGNRCVSDFNMSGCSSIVRCRINNNIIGSSSAGQFAFPTRLAFGDNEEETLLIGNYAYEWAGQVSPGNIDLSGQYRIFAWMNISGKVAINFTASSGTSRTVANTNNFANNFGIES